MKKINEIKLNINLTTILLILIILGLGVFGGIKLHRNKVNNLNDKYESQVRLTNALTDRVKYYQNKEEEWVAEKLTIQTSLKNLENLNGKLSESQQELVRRIRNVERDNTVIAAALIQANVKLDSLLHEGDVIVDTTNKNITFIDNYKDGNKEIQYNITVGNVLPSPTTATPTLSLNSLYFPNTQFIEFHWKNDKKKGYPISFSVTNTNEYFNVANIESYAIENLRKEFIDPNGWQKFVMWLDRNGNRLTWFGIGGAVGIAAGAMVF